MNPNRNKVLIGFGVVAIVLIAGIAFWPPKFSNEEASGAIGVVQKHHAPQIAQNDVILGDEKTRDQQSVLYRDYLTEAAKLQSISAQLASKDVQTASISLAMQELASNLRSRYMSQMQSALASIELSAKQASNVELAQKAEELAARAQASRDLSLAQMQELNASLAHMVQAESKGETNLQSIEASLASALASRDEAAASKLKAATAELSSINLASVSLADRSAYLDHMTEALGIILQSEELASHDVNMQTRLSAAESLADRANQLQHAALQNIQMQAQEAGQMASALAHMQTEATASANLGSAVQELASFQQELGSFREEFASKTQSSFQAELAAMNEFAQSKAQFSKMSSANLEASMLGNAQMASRVYSSLANTVELANTAHSLGIILQNQELASALQNEVALAATAEQLASRKQ